MTRMLCCPVLEGYKPVAVSLNMNSCSGAKLLLEKLTGNRISGVSRYAKQFQMAAPGEKLALTSLSFTSKMTSILCFWQKL